MNEEGSMDEGKGLDIKKAEDPIRSRRSEEKKDVDPGFRSYARTMIVAIILGALMWVGIFWVILY